MLKEYFAMVLAMVAATANAEPVEGYWLTENGKAIIQIEECDDGVCGRMAWMANPLDGQGKRKLDVNNSDSALASRTICGLPMVGGMERKALGIWKDGWIYNPRDGETYSAEVSSASDTKLKVRGYVGLPLLGRSQIWTRVEDDRGGC